MLIQSAVFLLELTWLVSSVAPNASLHVARAGREEVARRTWRNRDDAVLVSLQHHMGVSSLRIPELHATVFRTRHDPVTVGCQTDAQHVILEQKSAV
jgi:hypothetical protein